MACNRYADFVTATSASNDSPVVNFIKDISAQVIDPAQYDELLYNYNKLSNADIGLTSFDRSRTVSVPGASELGV